MPRSKFQFYPLMEGEPGAAGGGAAAAAATKPEPETFSREYVTELRGENATYRTKAKDADAKREAAEAAAKKWLSEGRRVRIALPPTPGLDWNDYFSREAIC